MNPTPEQFGAVIEPAVDRLLRDAQDWHLLAKLFERPSGCWWQEVRDLASVVDDADLGAAGVAAAETTEGRYLAALGPSGAVSPREVAHCGMRDPGQLLAQLSAWYDAFGYQPRTEEPIDHVAVETGFVGFLRLKEAYARSRGDEEQAAVVADAAERFADEHLREMARPLAERLKDRADACLAQAAALLVRRVGEPRPADSSRVIWLEDESLDCPGPATSTSEES